MLIFIFEDTGNDDELLLTLSKIKDLEYVDYSIKNDIITFNNYKASYKFKVNDFKKIKELLNNII